jgi:hypothetical protein
MEKLLYMEKINKKKHHEKMLKCTYKFPLYS